MTNIPEVSGEDPVPTVLERLRAAFPGVKFEPKSDDERLRSAAQMILNDHAARCIAKTVQWHRCDDCGCSRQVYCATCDDIILVVAAPVEQRCEAAEIALREYELAHYPLNPL